MIFLSVGTQFSFDRLVSAVDDWAWCHKSTEIVAQIGETNYRPRAITAFPYIEPEKFNAYQRTASLLISHAGMGAILGALELGKPVIIMPRLCSKGEHRNDHQVATAKKFSEKRGIYVAWDHDALVDLLMRRSELLSANEGSAVASSSLIKGLKDFLGSTLPKVGCPPKK